MTGYHTRWVPRPEQADDPERIAIREALAFGKAVYDQRCALGLTIAELAGRAGLTADEIECIEEGGTEPTIALLRHLAAALDSDVRLTAGHGLGSVWFETPRRLTKPARAGGQASSDPLSHTATRNLAEDPTSAGGPKAAQRRGLPRHASNMVIYTTRPGRDSCQAFCSVPESTWAG